ncbi:MAG TPA: DUF2231 domain-containing protein [Jiangellaceae bacterium]
MPDEILGIPLHPLVVHATVVFVPLAVLGTLVFAAVPRWRRGYGWLVSAVSFVALVTVPLATRSGKRLRDSLELGGPVLEKIQEHEQMGDRVIWAVAPMFAFNLAAMLMIRARRSSAEVTVVAVLASVAAIAAGVLVVITGHLGSQAVWNPGG